MRGRDLNKERLVRDTAIQMLVEQGLQGFSMNKLAGACNISVATLYIYYKDKDDLIRKLGDDVGSRHMDALLSGFSPEMRFREGIRKQWENRSQFYLKYPLEAMCAEIIRHSPYGECMDKKKLRVFKDAMSAFVQNAIDRGELKPMPVEAFWSIVYGPLYTLLRFHSQGSSLGGRKFVFTKELMLQTLEMVLEALSPSVNKK